MYQTLRPTMNGGTSQMTTLSHGGPSQTHICAVCQKRHTSNHPHMIQKVIPRPKNLAQLNFQ